LTFTKPFNKELSHRENLPKAGITVNSNRTIIQYNLLRQQMALENGIIPKHSATEIA